MAIKHYFILLILILQPLLATSQMHVRLQSGFSYQEHVSTGMVIDLNPKNQVSFLYGSNLFIRTHDFSSILAGYTRNLIKWKIIDVVPLIGFKTGYAVFSDKYYRWKLAEFIPYLGGQYAFSPQMDFFVHAGVAISYELAQVRTNYGEIGNYRTYLPEIKIGVTYKLF